MVRIDVLPDDVLLDIFIWINGVNGWRPLVHVCRRWRSLVFQSPCRLSLRLNCSPKTPARNTLDVWPALPLVVGGRMALSGTDNIIAALGQSNRVCQVDLWDFASWQLEKVLAAMQVPFPELTNLDLELSSNGQATPVIPDSFLGGSAPRLRHFHLFGVPFPGMPKLLLSATQLAELSLSDIPHSGYISPEAMVALLSVFPSLRILSLEFQSPQSRPGWESRSLPPLKRSILPALWRLQFKGVTEYLEELVTPIDTPQLTEMDVTFFNQIDFDCPRLAQFINRTPKLGARDEALVQFDHTTASVKLRYRTSKSILYDLEISVSCRELDWQLSSIEQVCNSSLSPLSTVKVLYIEPRYLRLDWMNDAIENALWLDLLLSFTAVENLYLSKEFAPGIAAALQELVGGRIMEVLPSLQYIFVKALRPSGRFQKNIGPFVAARRLSGHPFTISVWDK
jgi:hypothetical protein